jgi:hypothetical protein
LVSQVEAVETATQRKLDLYTEQPSFRSTVVEITGSAEELHSREPERGGREKLPVGPGSRIPLPASASDRLREQVKRFVGERDYDHYWGRTQSNHFFTPPLAGILEAELRFCSSGILHHETVVRKSRGQMLFWYFKRAAVQAGYRLIDGKPVETAMPMPGGYRAEGTPENRACPGK